MVPPMKKGAPKIPGMAPWSGQGTLVPLFLILKLCSFPSSILGPLEGAGLKLFHRAPSFPEGPPIKSLRSPLC